MSRWVSLCSNVPGYDEPKCFVSSGNTREMIKQFIDHLVQISQESYALLLDRFSDVFEQINQRMANNELKFRELAEFKKNISQAK